MGKRQSVSRVRPALGAQTTEGLTPYLVSPPCAPTTPLFVGSGRYAPFSWSQRIPTPARMPAARA